MNNLTGSSPLLKFGSVSKLVEIPVTQFIIPTIAMGIVGGCLGAFFINVNTRMAVVRKKLLTKKWMKPVETLAFSFVTASCLYFGSYMFKEACIPMNGSQTQVMKG